jgi:hypothetical protein
MKPIKTAVIHIANGERITAESNGDNLIAHWLDSEGGTVMTITIRSMLDLRRLVPLMAAAGLPIEPAEAEEMLASFDKRYNEIPALFAAEPEHREMSLMEMLAEYRAKTRAYIEAEAAGDAANAA